MFIVVNYFYENTTLENLFIYIMEINKGGKEFFKNLI